MAIDFEALKAKLRAKAEANITEAQNENSNSVAADAGSTVVSSVPAVQVEQGTSSSVVVPTVSTAPTVTPPAVLGTSKTTEIDHIDFLSKMNRLAEAIHAKHPTMPVLLMQIHKQLRTDPELVTTLDDEAIGIIVSGLQIQTKTELVSTVVKESKSKAKKIAVSVDML